MCVLSGCGTVSSVTLRQPASAGVSVIYEVETFNYMFSLSLSLSHTHTLTHTELSIPSFMSSLLTLNIFQFLRILVLRLRYEVTNVLSLCKDFSCKTIWDPSIQYGLISELLPIAYCSLHHL